MREGDGEEAEEEERRKAWRGDEEMRRGREGWRGDETIARSREGG